MRPLKSWEKGLDREECPRRIGWKHGPILFLLPVYNAVTSGRFTFVHLIRDGRDMAFSRNRNNLAKYPRFGGQVVGLFTLGKGNHYNRCVFLPEKVHSAESDKECILMQVRGACAGRLCGALARGACAGRMCGKLALSRWFLLVGPLRYARALRVRAG